MTRHLSSQPSETWILGGKNVGSPNLVGATGNASKQLGEIVGVQPVQSASQTVIIEHLSRDSWLQQLVDGDARQRTATPDTTVGGSILIH